MQGDGELGGARAARAREDVAKGRWLRLSNLLIYATLREVQVETLLWLEAYARYRVAVPRRYREVWGPPLAPHSKPRPPPNQSRRR